MCTLHNYVAIYVFLIYLGGTPGEEMLAQKCLQLCVSECHGRAPAELPIMSRFVVLTTPERPDKKQRSL